MLRKSCLRLAFLRRVEGLGFLVLVIFLISLLLVSKEKEKLEPMEREKLKASPWVASARQKSMHLVTRGEFSSPTAHILALLLNHENWRAAERHAATAFTFFKN